MPVFNSKCNCINWVPTKELQHQETQNNLHYQPHTETKSTRSDSSEVLLRPLMDVLLNAESTAWLVLPWTTIIWILGPSCSLAALVWRFRSTHPQQPAQVGLHVQASCFYRNLNFPPTRTAPVCPHTPNCSGVTAHLLCYLLAIFSGRDMT